MFTGRYERCRPFVVTPVGSYSKEGVLLRNVSPPSVLSDHFPGGGILEL